VIVTGRMFQAGLAVLLLTWPALADKSYDLVRRGNENTLDYYIYFRESDSNTYVSPWHDIPMRPYPESETFNMLVEIPRFSQPKYEISRYEKLNPVMQDRKEDSLRYLPNLFPWHGHFCNYGAIPQTWEDPYKEDPWTGQKGDKDPIDICEIGSLPIATGTVVEVRVLGVLAMLDDGETDWKVIAMNKEEADMLGVNDLDDLEGEMEEQPELIRKWFKIYKVPAGKPENRFGFGGKWRNKEFAEEVILATHEHWKKLVSNTTEHDTIQCLNTMRQGSPCQIDQATAEDLVDNKPEPGDAEDLPPDVDKWSYVEEQNSGSGSERGVVSTYVVFFVALVSRRYC